VVGYREHKPFIYVLQPNLPPVHHGAGVAKVHRSGQTGVQQEHNLEYGVLEHEEDTVQVEDSPYNKPEVEE